MWGIKTICGEKSPSVAMSLSLYAIFIKSLSLATVSLHLSGWLWPTFNMAASYDQGWWQWKLILLKKLLYFYKIPFAY